MFQYFSYSFYMHTRLITSNVFVITALNERLLFSIVPFQFYFASLLAGKFKQNRVSFAAQCALPEEPFSLERPDDQSRKVGQFHSVSLINARSGTFFIFFFFFFFDRGPNRLR